MVAALMCLGLMLGGGMATLSVVDSQTSSSRIQRERESAFNLAESALNAQVFALARDWPGTGNAATPYATCTQDSTSPRCPDATAMTAGASSVDLGGATWATSVRDNGTAATTAFFSDAGTAGQPGYDANGDGKLWIRAQATAKGRTRALVAQVRSEQQEEDMPRAAVLAGHLEHTNMGNKVIVNGNGGLVAVRCVPALLEPVTCLGQTPGSPVSAAVQISGSTPITGYTGGNAISEASRERLKKTAIANGTYFTSCPSADQLTGQVVYIVSGACSYTSNTQFNSPEAPGLLILETATLYLGGTTTFHGIVFGANTLDTSGTVVQVQGNAQVLGGVLINGNGGLVAGSSKQNVVFDANAFQAARSYSAAGVIQNTWREIKP